MPDICMCKNKKCPKRMKCYRFIADPGMRQSYSEFEHTKSGCSMFLEAKRFLAPSQISFRVELLKEDE